jgi:hypothetical protein
MISLAPPADAQVAPAGTAGSSSAAAKAGATTAPASRPLKQEELDQLLAPIALYPDQLLTQLLMASTYPLEIVQADRWVKANPKVKDKALSDALEKQTWDPSVKSLVNFPQVLAMMSEKLDLTIRLGDAFIAQQSDVLNTVQKLRGKAQTQGQLKNNEQQKVIVEAPPPQVSQTTVVVEQVTPPPAQIIKIEPTQPSVVYVPTYSPTVVYGGWPYPSYPPAPYYPPGYVASNVMSFGLGVACGAAWGYAWGNSNWGGGNVDIDVDRTNFNRNINRESYKGNVSNRQNNISGGKGNWQHNSAHRGSVPYRDAGTANKYGGAQQRQASQARSDYRGRTDSGLGSTGGARASNNAAGGAGNRTGAGGAGVDNRAAGGAGGVGNRTGAGGAGVDNRSAAGGGGGGAGAGNRTGAGGSGSSGAGNRATPSAANRSSSSGGGGGSAFSGSGSGGSAARSSSARGQSSRSSSSGGSRSGGGGGSRGGGGGGRGGGGGGRR